MTDIQGGKLTPQSFPQGDRRKMGTGCNVSFSTVLDFFDTSDIGRLLFEVSDIHLFGSNLHLPLVLLISSPPLSVAQQCTSNDNT